jgi:hypothetical protein
MDCKNVRKYICDYMDLNPERKSTLEKHFELCPHCKEQLTSYQKSCESIKKALEFEAPLNYWNDFALNLSAEKPHSLLSRLWANQVSEVIGFLRTPLLGPVPAYLFSVLLLVFLALGLFPTLFSEKKMERWPNNLVIAENQLISAVDDGRVTIYTVATK